MKIFKHGCMWRSWRRGVVVITTLQLHSTKPELRFCAGSNPARGGLEICDGEGLWQWYQLEIRINAFRWSTIPQKQFIIIIITPEPIEHKKKSTKLETCQRTFLSLFTAFLSVNKQYFNYLFILLFFVFWYWIYFLSSVERLTSVKVKILLSKT